MTKCTKEKIDGQAVQDAHQRLLPPQRQSLICYILNLSPIVVQRNGIFAFKFIGGFFVTFALHLKKVETISDQGPENDW